MCLIKGAFVGENNFDVIKMHGTTIKINFLTLFLTSDILKKQYFNEIILILDMF
jgi:hypothetical protein